MYRATTKENVTVIFTFAASGKITPPMIIYSYKRFPQNIRDSVPNEWGISISDNGWMTKEVFYEYISKVFYPYLKKNGTTFPIILFVDGHSTHQTLAVSRLCLKLEIV